MPMKFFAPALIFCGAASFGQSPQVPHKMQFAGLTLTIRDDARREIQKDVDALTLHPKYFNIKVERAKTYFPTIEKIFAEERLPDDFKFLCLQESALVPDAGRRDRKRRVRGSHPSPRAGTRGSPRTIRAGDFAPMSRRRAGLR